MLQVLGAGWPPGARLGVGDADVDVLERAEQVVHEALAVAAHHAHHRVAARRAVVHRHLRLTRCSGRLRASSAMDSAQPLCCCCSSCICPPSPAARSLVRPPARREQCHGRRAASLLLPLDVRLSTVTCSSLTGQAARPRAVPWKARSLFAVVARCAVAPSRLLRRHHRTQRTDCHMNLRSHSLTKPLTYAAPCS